MKEALSRQAGRRLPFISSAPPSNLIPFKGEFPIVEDWRLAEYYDQINSHEYLDECPEWVQKAVLRSEQVGIIHNGFIIYLAKTYGSAKNYWNMSDADKSKVLAQFMDSECLSEERLNI